MRRTLFVLLAVVALAGAACGGGDDSADGGGNGEPASDCVDLSSGESFSITIAGFAFEPSCLTAAASQSISITNEDAVTHTFTIQGTQIDVGIAPGETFNGEPVTGVVEPGTYTFICTIHPVMTGEITIV